MRIVAETGAKFADFGVYVPSINNRGEVAFQANLLGGGSGVVIEERVVCEREAQIGEIVSHPDVNDRGDVCFYANRDGVTRMVVLDASGQIVFESPVEAGPFGPTMNEAGAAAYRGTLPSGEAAVFSTTAGLLAKAGERFREFHGLPLMSESGRVSFRADLLDGTPGIFWESGESVAEGFDEIGRFPSVDANGRIGFVARLGSDWGVYHSESGPFSDRRPSPPGPLSPSRGEGEVALRGVLINTSGVVVFYATPEGGDLGVYLIGSSEPKFRMNGDLFGSPIVDFALNPVSANERGQFAVRVKLKDARQFILAF